MFGRGYFGASFFGPSYFGSGQSAGGATASRQFPFIHNVATMMNR